MERVVFVSVYIDKDLYASCLVDNSFIHNNCLCATVGFDNTHDNQNISVRYNQFLKEYDFSSSAWFVFCHSDWEVREDVVPLFEQLDKNSLYGPIGAVLLYDSCGGLVREYRGQCFEKKRDGTNERHQRCVLTDTGVIVDTFDCQCLIVHSSLVEKYNLRFDDNLKFDLYVEDFCINAKLAHNIKSKIVNIKCCHWNQLDDISQRPQYFDDLVKLNQKYPDSLFAGVVTLLGGKSTSVSKGYANRLPELVYGISATDARGTVYHVSVDPNEQNDAKALLYQFVTPGSIVLDVGCACGDLGVALKTYKACTLYGLEYNFDSVVVARSTGAYEAVRQVDLNLLGDDEYPEYASKFDYMIFGDVLEHLYCPQEVLRKMLGYLKPGGRLLISLPNIAHASIKANLLLNDFSYTDVGLLDRTHIRFFTHKSIPSFLAENKIVIEKYNYTVWDILGFQPENPYPYLPASVKNFLLRDPHSYVCQYVINSVVRADLSFQECVNLNCVLHNIDEQCNYFLKRYKTSFLATSFYAKTHLLMVKCIVGLCMLPSVYVYAGSLVACVQGLRKGKAFFEEVALHHYIVEDKVESKGRLLQAFVRRSFKFAMTLKRARSLRTALGKVKRFLMSRFISTNNGSSLIGSDLATRSRYASYILRTEPQTEEDLCAISLKINSWAVPPILTLHMHVGVNVLESARATICSVVRQLYPHWEMVLTAPPQVYGNLEALLKEFSDDRRMRIVIYDDPEFDLPENIALNVAEGQFFIILDGGDLLPIHALYYIALEIVEYPGARLIYSDADVITDGIRHSPFFKPDWNEELFLNQDYLCRLSAYKTILLRENSGFRREYVPCQAYDAALRLAVSGTPSAIRHIPRVLYHYGHNDFCLFNEDSREKGRQAVVAYLKAKDIDATVVSTEKKLNQITYSVKMPLPMVSCIIGMKDKAAMTRTCLKGILQETDYYNLEVILVDNESVEQESFALFDDLQTEKRVRIIHWDRPFNYSQIQNMAVNEAKGAFVALLNNDIEIICPEWLREMVGYAQRPQIGAVGARLLFANDSLQHAGIILGPNGAVGHAFRDLHKDTQLQKNLAHAARWISGVTAACLVISKEKYLAVGGFNEKELQIGYNDVDFCIRLHLLGYNNVYTPHATLRHLESISRGKDVDPIKRSREQSELQYIISRYGQLLRSDPQYNLNLSFLGTNYDVLEESEPLRLRDVSVLRF